MKAGAKAGSSASGGGGVTSKKPYKPKAHGAKKPGSGSMKSEKSASGGGTPDGRNSPVSSPSTPPPLPVATPAKAVTGTSVRSLSRRLTMKNFDRAPKKEAISTVDPDDVEEDPTKGRCMLTPTAPIKMKWDIVMLFLILYNVIMVPVRICFEVEAPAGSIEFWLETFFDMLFIVDIVLNFNSAYVNDEGSLETNRSKIASTYLRGWFLIDGPSSLPTEPVMELIGLAIPDLGIGSTAPEPEGCVTEGGGDTAMMMPKLLRFLRMIRFMKLIRLLKAAKIFKVMEEELDVNMSVLKLFKLVFIVVFLGHLIACFVFLANKAAQDDNFFGMFRLPQFYGCQNTTTLEWVELLPDDWSPSIGNAYPEWPTKDDCSCENQGIWRWKIVPGEQYVWVLYWTLTTMTTIGYGDVSPLTYVEAIITVIVEVAGASIFGYMIGNIASVIADFDKFSSVQKERMEEIKSYLTFKRVPRQLSKSVRKYYGHYYDKRGVDALKQDWGALPNIIKAELVKFMNKEFVDAFKCFLPVAGYDFIEVLVEQLRPLLVELGTCIAGPDKQPPAPSPPSCDFFLICSGEVHKLAILDPAMEVPFKEGDEDDTTQLSPGGSVQLVSLDSRNLSSSSRLERVMKPGEWFGHIELLAAFDEIQIEEELLSPLQWRHEYKAKRICELLYLIDSDFYENVENYRMFRAVLEAQDAVQEEEDDCETETDMGLKAAPAASDGSTVLAASSSTAGDYGAPPPVSVPEGDVLDNRSSSDQQSSDPKRDLLSPTLNMASVVAAAGKKAAKSVSLTGKQGAGANKDAASIADKWGGKKPGSKATAGAKVPQAQLDEQLLRQKIETEVFGLPLRRADQITDLDILALIRSRAESALPARASAPSTAASGPGTPAKAPISASPSRTPRPSSEMSD